MNDISFTDIEKKRKILDIFTDIYWSVLGKVLCCVMYYSRPNPLIPLSTSINERHENQKCARSCKF